MGATEVEAFLSWLASTRKVAASTHKQALSALLFFFGKVLGVDLPWLQEIGRPRTKTHLPVVLSPNEVARILCVLRGEYRLFAQLLYGTGMRINEGLQLRVKDVDFELSTIIVREGKGGKDRKRSAHPPLGAHNYTGFLRGNSSSMRLFGQAGSFSRMSVSQAMGSMPFRRAVSSSD